MTVTYGFYNSQNHDRKYNASQLSSMFDGIINDGVFASIGTSLIVTEGSGMTVNIGIGRAWFNSTWTNNDSILPITLEQSDVLLNRIDIVALEVGTTSDLRENKFKVIKGTPATNPLAPTLIKSAGIYQYPLCHIYIKAGATSIIQANITNKVGTSECPFITGILQTINTNQLVSQWESEFDVWFEDLKAQMEGNVATNLQNQINIINNTSLPAKLNTNGDGKDVTVTFAAGNDAEITSGEKLSAMFGKLLTKLKNINTAITNIADGTTFIDAYAKASHAVSTGTNGIATLVNYGHVILKNSLDQAQHTNGVALSAYQGKVLNDKMKYNIATISASGTWTIPAGVTELEVICIAGGYGGGGGGAAYVAYNVEGGDGEPIVKWWERYSGDGGAGGNSGAIIKKTLKYIDGDFEQGEAVSCTIGAGGIGAAGQATSRSATSVVAGGATSFGTKLTTSGSSSSGGYGGAGGSSTSDAGTTGTAGRAGTAGGVSTAQLIASLIPTKSLGSGGGGGGGAVFIGGSYYAAGAAGNTGAGAGGRGGALGAVGASGSNATIYGHGGGGGGGAGCAATQPSGTVYTSNAASKGGNGFQGVIYVGYRTFAS